MKTQDAAKPRFHTIGYSGRTPESILQVMNELGAVLADVRLKPFSRWQPHWNGAALANLLGPLYVGVPELGNLNYKGGPIAIADYGLGRARLLALGRPAILMCACKDASTCHRTTIAEMLRADGYRVDEVQDGAEAPRPPKRGPKGPSQATMFFM